MKYFKTAILLTVLATCMVAPGTQALAAAFQDTEQPDSRVQDSDPGLESIPSSLGAMLDLALRGNPKLALAQAELEQASFQIHEAQLVVTQQTVEVFDSLRQSRQSLELVVRNTERIRALVNSGSASTAELMRAEQELAAAEAKIRQVEGNARLVLGMEISVDDLRGKSGKKFQLPEVPNSLEKMLTMALEKNSSIRITQAERHLAEAKYLDQRLQVIRDVTFSFYERSKQNSMAERLRAALDETRRGVEAGVVSTRELTPMILEVSKAEASVVQVEAGLRYLMGLGRKRAR